MLACMCPSAQVQLIVSLQHSKLSPLPGIEDQQLLWHCGIIGGRRSSTSKEPRGLSGHWSSGFEVELELPSVPAPVTPVALEDDEVFVVLSVDDFDADAGVHADLVAVAVIVAAEFVGRGPAVSVTSCPPPRAAPPSVKLVKISDIVVVEPVISAVPDPEQAPVKLEYEQPISTVLRTSYGLAISRLEVSIQ
jgi:hypothetical protein